MPAPFDAKWRFEKAGESGDHNPTVILVVGQIIAEAGAVRVRIPIAICVNNVVLLQFAEGGRVGTGVEQVYRSYVRIGQQMRAKHIRRCRVGINEKNPQLTSRQMRVFGRDVIFSGGCPNTPCRSIDIP